MGSRFKGGDVFGHAGGGGGGKGYMGLTGRDTLDTTTTSETANGGLGDALDVVTEDFAMAFGSAFAEAFAALSTYRYDMLIYFFKGGCTRT